MLTVRNMRPKPELKADNSMLWVAGFVVLALLIWTVRLTFYSAPEQTKPIPEKPAGK